MTDPEVLLQAEFLQRFNGDTGFFHTDRYRENWNPDAFFASDEMMRQIYNQYGTYRGAMAEMFNLYDMANILTDTYTVLQDAFGIGKASKVIDFTQSFPLIQEQLLGVIKDLVDLSKEIDRLETEITTEEYLFAQAASGLVQLENEAIRDRLAGDLGRLSESSPFLSSYDTAETIEQYSVLQAQNQVLHPLVLKYFRDPDNYGFLKILDWIGAFPKGRLDAYEAALEAWMGEAPELRGAMQDKMWFTKEDDPDGKALLALDRSRIEDPDLLAALEEIERLGEEYQKLLAPADGENEVGNQALLQELKA